MNIFKNKVLFKVFFGLAVLCLLSLNGFPRFYTNGTPGGFDDDPTPRIRTGMGNSQIELYVVDGAGYFLASHSDIVTFSTMVEQAETPAAIDLIELRNVLSGAIANMEGAKNVFSNLIDKAEITPYNQEAIALLSAFDYPGFMTENNLDPVIFQEVEEYLVTGDIVGIYRNCYSHMEEILSILNSIDEQLDNNEIPTTAQLQGLNNVTSSRLLYGQYVARVFYAL